MECSNKTCRKITIDGFKHCLNCRLSVRKSCAKKKDKYYQKQVKYRLTVKGKVVSRITKLKRSDDKHKRVYQLKTYITSNDVVKLWERSPNCYYCNCLMQFEDGLKKDGATIERLDNTLARRSSRVSLRRSVDEP